MGPIGLLRVSALLAPIVFVVCNDFLLIHFTTLILFAHGIYLSQWRLARAYPAEHLDILILRAMAGYFTFAAAISFLQLPSMWDHMSQRHPPEDLDPRISKILNVIYLAFHTLLPCGETRVLWKILSQLQTGPEISETGAPATASSEDHGVVKPGSDAV